MDRSLLEQQVLLSEKPGPILLVLVDLTEGREGGRRQMNLNGFQDILTIFYRLNYLEFLFPLIPVQCCYSVTNAFQPAFLK